MYVRLLAALFVPAILLADLNQTNLLTAGNTINLETGVVGSSGGDILWDASGITPQGKATALHIYSNWPVDQFGTISVIVVSYLSGYSNATIPPSKLNVGDVIGVHANGGHWAKIIVTKTSSTSITLQFTTFGVAAGPGSGNAGPPTITAVVNNSSQIPGGLPNSGIAPSSIFIVIGSGLADPGLPTLQDSTKGLPLTLNGASITVTSGSVTNHPAIYYTSPGQIAAVLPATTPVGSATLTVTYNGVASNSFAFAVVPSAPGINTYYTNSGVATDAASYAVLTYNNSGAPGQNIVIWATGLGSNTADSDTTFTSTPHSVNTPLQIYIGGVQAPILYQGSAGYPGVNQINVTIPANVSSGCWISLAAVSGGVLSNLATLPINQGGGPCYDPVNGLHGNQIAPPGQQTLRTGLVAITQSTSTKDVVSASTDAAFESYTGVFGPTNSVSPGSCILKYGVPPAAGAITGLDPGGVSLAGPNGLSLSMAKQPGITGAYYSNLSSGAIPPSGGTFTFTGPGGANVGSFMSSLTFTSPLFSWTNRAAAASIDRTQGFTATWSGGNPNSWVLITGFLLTPASPTNTAGEVVFVCWASVADGKFTVPPYILSALPAGNGSTQLQDVTYLPLSATGIDIGLTVGEISIASATTFK